MTNFAKTLQNALIGKNKIIVNQDVLLNVSITMLIQILFLINAMMVAQKIILFHTDKSVKTTANTEMDLHA